MRSSVFAVLPMTLAVALSACTSTATSQPIKKPVAPTQTAQPDKPVVALVLSGGGTRGFAHIGVIDALHQHGIRPNLVVGTSAGAMVGAIYASGKTPAELTELAKTLEPTDLIDITPSKQGLVDGNKLRQYINKQVKNQPIERLPIRFAAVATETQSRTAKAFTTGETGLAVQASASVAKLFVAPRIPENHGKKYQDGSSTALLPARIAKSLGADVIIAVDVMANAKSKQSTAENKQARTISIDKTEQGISAKWGGQTIDIPLDLSGLEQASKDLPFNLPLGEIIGGVLGSIPKNTTFELPTDLPTSVDDVYRIVGDVASNQQADPADVAVSTVVIRPDTAILGITPDERHRLIQAGKDSTNAQIDAIKQAIAAAQYTPVK